MTGQFSSRGGVALGDGVSGVTIPLSNRRFRRRRAISSEVTVGVSGWVMRNRTFDYEGARFEVGMNWLSSVWRTRVSSPLRAVGYPTLKVAEG